MILEENIEEPPQHQNAFQVRSMMAGEFNSKLGETKFFEEQQCTPGSWGGYHTQHSSREGTQRTGTWSVSAAGEVLLALGGLKGPGRGVETVAFSVGRSNGLLCLRRKTQSSIQLVIGSVPLGTEYKRVRAKK